MEEKSVITDSGPIFKNIVNGKEFVDKLKLLFPEEFTDEKTNYYSRPCVAYYFLEKYMPSCDGAYFEYQVETEEEINQIPMWDLLIGIETKGKPELKLDENETNLFDLAEIKDGEIRLFS